MLRSFRWCVAAMVVCCCVTARAADFFFKDGDVIVMIGDSITEQHLYSNYVEMWTVTRFPTWKLTFRNVGIGGDTSGGGNSRFARDVLPFKPTAMTVDFGMNDGRYQAFNDGTFKPYMDGLQGMANQAKAANIRVAWCTPQPLDDAVQGPTALTGYNITLEKFSEGVKTIADQNGGLFVDQFHPYLATLNDARAKSPKYDRITDGDAVHPGPPGQALMAAAILKGLNFPKLVSSAEIDAAGGKLVNAENCKIDGITKGEGGSLKFSRLDGALPFFPPEATKIVTSSKILEELNDYRLKVTGLAAGKYEVRVGNTKVAELSAEQLGAGVNLTFPVISAGPISEQMKAVKAAVEAKNRFHHDRIFRGIVLAGGVPDWVYDIVPREELEPKKKTVHESRLAKLPALDAEVAKTLEMKPNVFELVPVK